MSYPVATSASVAFIEHRIAPLQETLNSHPLYAAIRTLADLRLFMELHVFAVWDFMSLLKSLQRGLTCVEVPWVPSAHASSRRFINEIVLGEESDVYEGRPASHFEIYLGAMQRVGASTTAIETTVKAARQGRQETGFDIDLFLGSAPTPAVDFVRTTFHIIENGSMAAQAAAFTFGREDAIPDMFRALIRELNHQVDGDLSPFIWYLERHIEVDGDDHGPLSRNMVNDLCGSDPDLWEEAARAAEDAIRARLLLWDGILLQLKHGM